MTLGILLALTAKRDYMKWFKRFLLRLAIGREAYENMRATLFDSMPELKIRSRKHCDLIVIGQYDSPHKLTADWIKDLSELFY